MKFQQVEAFEKHLTDAADRHLSLIYAITLKDEQERRQLLGFVKERLFALKDSDIIFAQTAEKALAHLQTTSLFGARPIAFFSGDCSPFDKYSPQENTHLILGDGTAKALKNLYSKHKKLMVWLDLTGEKPWEKKQRLERFAVRALQREGKRFTGEAVAALMQRAGSSACLLETEIEKLVCYAGDEITLQDVNAIGIPIPHEGGFPLAEEIVWKAGLKCSRPISDLATLLPLIGQLRYLLEQGLVISSLKEQGKGPGEIGDELPHIHPRVIDKVLKRLGAWKSSYFVHGLKALFALELSAKNSEASPQVLFDRFRGSLSEDLA